jgi:hypothetical protein
MMTLTLGYLIGFVCYSFMLYKVAIGDARWKQAMEITPIVAVGLYCALAILWPFSMILDQHALYVTKRLLILEDEVNNQIRRDCEAAMKAIEAHGKPQCTNCECACDDEEPGAHVM